MLGNPISQGIFTILDDCSAGFITIITLTSFTRSYRGIVNQFQEVFSESSNDCKLLTMLPNAVELVIESGLDLFASNVG